MSCRRVGSLILRDLEGRLAEREAASVMTHLANCPACGRFRSEIAALRADLRDLPDPPASSDLPRRAVERWLAEGGVRRETQGARVVGMRWAAAACGAAVLVGALGLAAVRWQSGDRVMRAAVSGRRDRGQVHSTLSSSRNVPEGTLRGGSAKGRKELERHGVLAAVPHSEGLRHRPALTPPPAARVPGSPKDWERGDGRASLASHPSPRIGRGAGGEGQSPRDDLAYLNVDAALSVGPWSGLPVDDWAALEAQVRRSVRVKDDFVTIPFPRLAAADARQIAAAVESYKKEAVVVDTRLFQKLTLQAKAVSFEQFCQELERLSGIRIEVNRGVADEKVTALVKERPLRQIMRQVSRLFSYTWLRSGKPGEYRYELAQDLKSQLLEEELRNRDRNEALLAMDREMKALWPYVEMTPEAIRAKAQTATPEEKERLEDLVKWGWGPLQMYIRLSPEEMLALRSEQQLVYSSRPEGNDRPLPEGLGLPVLGMFPDYRVWRGEQGSGLGPPGSVPAGAESYEPKAAPGARATVSLQLSRHELGQIALVASSGFGAGGATMSRGDTLAVGVSPSVASPGNAKANAALARDPALQSLVSWRPESSCRHGVDYPTGYRYSRRSAASARQQELDEAAKAERDPAPVSVADVLAAIHRATGIDILSDAYTRLYPAAEVSVEKTRLFDALNRVADHVRYRWRREDGMLLFRSASFFNDKLKEVPNRLLERWAASVRQHGRITLDDILEIAGLRDVQLDSKLIAEGAVRCYGIKGWGLARELNLRKHLRFLGLLSPEQRRLAESPAGLSFGQMNAAQQQQYLTVAWGGSSDPIAPEALAGARLRIDLALPGEFEWMPEAAWHRFPGPQRVRAATRELALAAARRIDPAVTAADLVPTAAILQIEYRLGPSADGLIRYIEFGPSWSNSGEMAADAASVDPRERRSASEVRPN